LEPIRRTRRSVLQRNRKQQGIWLSMLLMIFVLFFGIVSFLAADRKHSDAENRSLAQAPEFSWQSLTDGSYFEGINDYLADQFVGRDFWISLRLSFTRFMGASESNGVLLCDDDYLMEKPTAPNEAALTRNLDAINGFAQRHPELNTTVSIVPTAAGVLLDKLPTNAPVRDQHADITAIAERLQNVKFADVTDSMRAFPDRCVYYHTDHHWTSEGAYHAFMDMADELMVSPIDEYAVYTVSNTFEGTLASKSGCHDTEDTIQIYVPKPEVNYSVTYVQDGETTSSLYRRDALRQKDQYTLFFGGNPPRIDIRTDSNTGRHLLLIKDSYANCMVQLLTPYYDSIVMIDPRFYTDSADELVTAEGITDVLFLYNINTFHEDTNLYKIF